MAAQIVTFPSDLSPCKGNLNQPLCEFGEYEGSPKGEGCACCFDAEGSVVFICQESA